MTCTQCNQEFEGRADAKFCSGACRAKANRTDNTRTDNVTDNRTDKSDLPLHLTEYNPTNFVPNWYRAGYKTKEEAKEALGWYKL